MFANILIFLILSTPLFSCAHRSSSPLPLLLPPSPSPSPSLSSFFFLLLLLKVHRFLLSFPFVHIFHNCKAVFLVQNNYSFPSGCWLHINCIFLMTFVGSNYFCLLFIFPYCVNSTLLFSQGIILPQSLVMTHGWSQDLLSPGSPRESWTSPGQSNVLSPWMAIGLGIASVRASKFWDIC